MSPQRLRGMGVALTTPFLQDGSIDYDTLDFHLDYLIDGNTDYIVALGTTAETPTLTHDEKKQLALHILDHVAGRCPLVVIQLPQSLMKSITPTDLKNLTQYCRWSPTIISLCRKVCTATLQP